MWSILPSLLIFVFIIITQSALASDKPPEHGGSGGATTAEMSKDQKEFVEKTAKLTTITNRIVETEKKFNELVYRKAEAKKVTERQSIIKEMLELTKQRNTDVETYNKLRSDLALRYPNHGEVLNRRYHTQTKRTVEELEGAAGLDELLTKTKKAIDRKFAPLMVDDKEKDAPAAVIAAPVDEKPKRLKLEK